MKKTISVILDNDVLKMIDEIARKEDRDRSYVIRQAITQYTKGKKIKQ